MKHVSLHPTLQRWTANLESAGCPLEPSLETLYAYAEHQLEPALVSELESLFVSRPDLIAEVEALRSPDPALSALIEATFEEEFARSRFRPWFRQALNVIEKFWRGAISTPAMVGSFAAIVTLLLVLPFGSTRLDPNEVSEISLNTGMETRGLRGKVAVIYEGSPIFVDHKVPEPFQQLVVAEVHGTVVSLLAIRERPLLPLEDIRLRAGRAPGQRFLVRILLVSPRSESSIREALAGVVLTNPDLWLRNPEERAGRFLQALGSDVHVSTSPAYVTEAR